VLTYTLEHMTSNCATADIDTVYRCLGFLLGFAGVISVGVIYNGARIALSERGRELSSLPSKTSRAVTLPA